MEYYKVFIFTVIILIFIYVLNDLYQIRCMRSVTESFIFNSPNGEYDQIKYNTNHGIANFNGNTMMPLNQYIIKSSYNSAISGEYVNIDMLRFVIARGVRFLDFEIVSLDGKPYVALTSDPSFRIIDTKNKLLLTDVLEAVNAFSFSNPAPCPNDPVFIQLRIKSDDPNVYEQVSKAIDSSLTHRRYKSAIDQNTTFNDVKGKAVIIFDNDIHPQYKELSDCDNPDSDMCYDIKKYINFTSNSEISTKRKYLEFIDSKSGKILTVNEDNTVNVDKLTIAVPEYFNKTNVKADSNIFTSSDVEHPNIYTYTDNYNVQMLCYRYYMRDEQLDVCEQFFARHKSSFIPYYIGMAFIKRIQQ